MGPPKSGCRRVQRIGAQHWLMRGCLIVLAFFLVTESAWAQIIPFHGTLEYSAASGQWPSLTVKAANGSPAYVLTLLPVRDAKENLVHIDLVLHRPGAGPDARNLLEPPGRWHGLQAYDFNASDFTHGPERSLYGPTRIIGIKNRKLNVTFSISKAEIAPVADRPTEDSGYVFKAFAVDIEVDDLK
jgi:hypothetical protein